MEEMRIIKSTLENLYKLLEYHREFVNWTKVDPGDEMTKQANGKRRFYAWILLSYLVNDLHHMGMIDEDTRVKIIDMLDEEIVRKG